MNSARRLMVAFEVRLGALGAACVVAAFVFARTGIPSWAPQAPIARLGIASPLTGMTRSFVAMSRGDLGTAWSWHPLGPAAFVVAAVAAVVGVWVFAGGSVPTWPAKLSGRNAAAALVAVLVIAWFRQIMEVSV